MYLGLDLSLECTGICLAMDSTNYHTETIPTKKMIGMERLEYICNRIGEITGGYEHGVTLAAIEGYAFAGKGKNYTIAEIGALVRYHLHLWKIPWIVVLPQHVKMFATGSGMATKVQIGEHLREFWGQDFLGTWKYNHKVQTPPADWGVRDSDWRNDEADAYVLANIAMLYKNAWDRTPNQKQLYIVTEVEVDPQAILSRQTKNKKRI